MLRALPHRATLARRPAAPGLIARLALALSLGRERRRLGRLDRHLLADIGLTDHGARQEAERPVWDAPERWRR